jgi:Zn-finger nucleic acid-binding protein
MSPPRYVDAMEAPYRAAGDRAAGALRCLYCGHPGTPARVTCDVCGADTPSVPCHACGQPVFEPADRCACGATSFAWNDPDERALGCPRCGGSLARKELDVATLHVGQCARCLGSFVRTRDFSELLDRATAGEAVGLRHFVPLAPGKELPQATLLAPAACPRCGREMDRVRFAQRASLVVDVCPTHGMWTDAGELVALVSFVNSRMAGPVAPGEAEREDEAKWNAISAARAAEERMVNLYADLAEAHFRDRRERSGGDP